jgi:RimJ/RimL family protein N-acetyltransferase
MIVRHIASQELAGFTEVFWSERRPQIAEQGHTAVLPKYRRRGLAQWLKGEMLQKILTQRPEIQKIRSNVADSNVSMLRINRQLGFKPYKTWTTWQIDLERVLAYLGEG